jgi:hypothetical protein
MNFYLIQDSMKKIGLSLLMLVMSIITLAQVPNKMSFQTVVRNNLGKLVVNKSIGVRLSILKTSSTGTTVYVETHSKTSNVNGLLTLEVGTGTVSSGAFTTIDWSQGPYFLKTEMDVNGGTNYTISGVTEFVSVPYAKMAENANNANSVKTLSNGANVGDMCYWNGTTWVPLNKGTQGQTLTFCDGKPAWTIGGVCPGMITALNCSSATNNGTLTATTTATGVTSVISYAGGNGGTHNGQVVTSTGVSGLTATLQAGTFANGNGNLTYSITGTPATSGTASFAINIAGKMCNIVREVLKFDSNIKTGFISKNETWYADSIYILDGKVIVREGATLTIQAGTIIKGKDGTATMASALIVSRGAKINAQGTKEKPIIFTSELDNINLGQTFGSNLSRTDNHKWGGLIILGNAPVSSASGDIEGNIEGIPASENYGKYGGNKIDDNSGVLNFVSLRHGGAIIGEGNEISGLTLGGVGNGTKIENIEIYATMDDGIECFGGSVNLKNILVYYQGDDAIDVDQNYSGTVENFRVIQGDGIGTDKGLEVDGPENTTYKDGLVTFRNGYLTSEGKEGLPADFKDKAQGKIENVTFDYTTATGKDLKIRAYFDAANACATKTDAYTNLINDKLIFTGLKFIGGVAPKVYMNISASNCTLLGDEQTNAINKINIGNGAILPVADFSWTNASKKGELK